MWRLPEDFTLRPEFRRGFRASVAFLIPLLICHWLGRTSDAILIAMSAQTMALPDLRGAYGMRLVILATITAAVAFAAVLGVWCGGSLVASILAAGFLALLGGVWRHLSADYGAHLSVASVLLFLLGLSQPGTLAHGWHLAGLIFIGGAGTALLHVVFWLFRPQHPLRYAVGETWVALSDVIASMRPPLDGAVAPVGLMMEKERELRLALDRTFVILGAAENKRRTALLQHLEEMRREVVHLAMRVTGLHAAWEPLMTSPSFAPHLPTMDSVIKALSDTARSVAITLISHRSENFAATEVRIQRCLHLIHVCEEQIAPTDASDNDLTQLQDALGKIALILPRIDATLATTIDHGPQGMARFPSRLPDLGGKSIRSVAVWMNPASQVDPVLVRHALRMALVMMGGVAVYKAFQIPHGYWIPFTMVVVLQPDFGSTRERAAQRIGGTFAGSLLGSALLWIKMPLLLLDGLAGLMSFGFAYYVKLRYGRAVFFVTIMIVLLTETIGPVHLDFTVSRLLCNAAGGAVALVAALLFWPIWEGGKFNTLLAASIRANRVYLASIARHLSAPSSDFEEVLASKRKAENASRYASTSLQRLLAEPGIAELAADRGTALTTYNQRITRALTAIAVHLAESPVGCDSFDQPIKELDQRLEKLAAFVEANEAHFGDLQSCPLPPQPPGPELQLIWSYLAKSLTETQAMALALDVPK
ncbi:MAG: FUSC family protein [Chthoniobacterales bacterium]